MIAVPSGVRRRLLAACLTAALAGWLIPVTPAGAFPLEVVPADHWTYKTLYRLAAWGLAPLWAASARPLTRMELAEMVAWGLERLAAERTSGTRPGQPASRSALEDLETLVLTFADELALLGYRVVDPPMGPSARAVTGWGVRLERAVVARVEAGEPHWMERAEGSSLRLQVRGVLGFGPSLAAGTEILKGLTWGDDPTAGLRRLYMSGDVMGALLQAGRDYLWWGPGSRGAFLLSDNAGPFDFVRASVTWNRLRYTKIVASLDHQDQFLYGIRMDWLARDNLRVGLGETVVGRGGAYFPYVLNPIPLLTNGLQLWVRQRGMGHNDNYNVALDFDWAMRPGALLYGEVYVDDITMRGNPFPSRLGGTLGLFLDDPLGDGRTSLRLEHTRVSNWVYTTTDRSNDYVRDGRTLGHWCAPDCELWSVSTTRRLHTGASIELGFDLVRKGEGRLGGTWTDPDDAWWRIYLSGIVETTHALRLGYSWMPRGGLSQAISLTWSAVSNAGHVSTQNRQDWFLKWEARHEF